MLLKTVNIVGNYGIINSDISFGGIYRVNKSEKINPGKILEDVSPKYYLVNVYTQRMGEMYHLIRGRRLWVRDEDNTKLGDNLDQEVLLIDQFIYSNVYLERHYNSKETKLTYILDTDNELHKEYTEGFFDPKYILEEFDEMNLENIVYMDLKYNLDIHYEEIEELL